MGQANSLPRGKQEQQPEPTAERKGSVSGGGVGIHAGDSTTLRPSTPRATSVIQTDIKEKYTLHEGVISRNTKRRGSCERI